MAQTKRYERFNAHFSNQVSEDLKTFVRDEVLLHSRYLYVKRIASTIQRGYCTHCKTDYTIKSTSTLKHNEDWQCEKCKSLVTVKHAGRSRGKMVDKAYVIWYEKSIVDQEVITATGYNVTMDYSDDRRGITTFSPVAKYVFEIGKATMMHRNYHFAGCYSTKVMRYGDGWSFAREPFSMIGKHSYTAHSSQSLESIKKAVEGTSFVYSPWSKFCNDNRDLIFFFSVFSKYPFIEYLYKMGMVGIVKAMVEKTDLHKAINLRGKTMEKILGLSKKEVKEWKASGVYMTPIGLKTYKWFRENDAPITWQTAHRCEQLIAETYYFDRLTFIQRYLPLNRIIRYILNQMQKEGKHHRWSITNTLISWKDYLEECIELGMDVTSESVLLPNSLHKAHQQTTRSIKVKRDEAVNKKIASLQPKLKHYWFETDNLFIRPAASSIELFDEGEALNHCVGRYAERYAKGEIVLMFIRRKSRPDKSFYTLELSLGMMQVTQCRGLKNRDMTNEVKQFVEAFKAEKLVKKSNRRKVVV